MKTTFRKATTLFLLVAIMTTLVSSTAVANDVDYYEVGYTIEDSGMIVYDDWRSDPLIDYFGREQAELLFQEIVAMGVMDIDPFAHWELDYTIVDRYSKDEIAGILHISVEDLYKMEEKGVYRENVAVLFASMLVPYDPDGRSRQIGGTIPNPGAGRVTIQRIRDGLWPTDIHLNPLPTHYGVRHGHVAMAFNTTLNIEIEGPGRVSTLIGNVHWGDLTSYARYWVLGLGVNNSPQRNQVVNYAVNNLMGIPYWFGSTAHSLSSVNCASLIWHAFHESGVITLMRPAGVFTPYTPRHLIDDPRVMFYWSHNWDRPR